MRKSVKLPKLFGIVIALSVVLGLSACSEDKVEEA